MPAVLFGSISTLADTSELQRQAFNEAFAEHGLDWQWEVNDYRARLVEAGGQARIAAYAAERGVDVDAAAVHATKSARFQQMLAATPPEPRPGVVEVLDAARRQGIPVGLVTTTSRENVEAMLAALADWIGTEPFAVVVDRSQVDAPKPDPEAFRLALQKIGQEPASAVAIEDNVDGVRAATAAGLACVAFPNAGTAGHEFPGAARVVDRLDLDELENVRSPK